MAACITRDLVFLDVEHPSDLFVVIVGHRIGGHSCLLNSWAPPTSVFMHLTIFVEQSSTEN